MAVKTYGIGLSDIKIKVEGATVGSPFESLTTIGEVADGSTTVTHEAPEETKFKGDYSDITLFTLSKMGDFMIETDVIEVSGEKWAALTGSTWTSGTKTLALPQSVADIFVECTLTFDRGLDKIRIVRGQLVANLIGANLKNEMFKVHLKVTAVPDAAGYVELVTK